MEEELMQNDVELESNGGEAEVELNEEIAEKPAPQKRITGSLSREDYIAKYGDDKGWLPPEQYFEKKKALESPDELKKYVNYLIAQNQRLESTVKTLEKDFSQYSATRVQQELKQNMEAQVEAINNGDNDKFQQLKKQEYELLQQRQPIATQPQSQPPAGGEQFSVEAQIEFGNKFWTAPNSDMFQTANVLYEQVSRVMPYASDVERLRETEKKLTAMYPERFGAPRAYSPSMGNPNVGVKKEQKSSKKDFASLPDSVKRQYEDMKRRGVVGTPERFASAYYQQ